MIDIREHRGSFSNSKNSNTEGFAMVTICGSNPKGISYNEAIRYFLTLSKKYYVGFVYNTASGNQNVFVFDRKTNKVIMRLASHSALPNNYVSYDSAGAGLIINNRWLIHTSLGLTRTSKRDLQGTASSIDLPTADAWAHSWLSPDEQYGYLCSYNRVAKYDSNGDEVWVCSTPLSGGYKRIIGEYGDYLYIMSQGTYMAVINKNTGVRLGGEYSSFAGTIVNGFISGNKIVLYYSNSNGSVSVYQIDPITFIPSATPLTQKTDYCLDPIPATKDRSKFLIGRAGGSRTLPAHVSDLYDISNLAYPLESSAADMSLSEVRYHSNSELVSVGQSLGAAGATSRLASGYYLTHIGKVV